MTEDERLEGLRYPVGRFERAEDPTDEDRVRWIQTLEALPTDLRNAVTGLEEAHLDTPYRPDGWTVRQVVHHVADSHVNGWVRFSLALNEEHRTAGLYDEKRWAEQEFARTGPIDASLVILDGLHSRWVATARTLDDEAFRRAIDHPEWGAFTVADLLSLYGWHSRHHVAHIMALRGREGWG